MMPIHDEKMQIDLSTPTCMRRIRAIHHILDTELIGLKQKAFLIERAMDGWNMTCIKRDLT
jgi:hypothetical protein